MIQVNPKEDYFIRTSRSRHAFIAPFQRTCADACRDLHYMEILLFSFDSLIISFVDRNGEV